MSHKRHKPYVLIELILYMKFASVLYRGLRSGGGSEPPLRGALISCAAVLTPRYPRARPQGLRDAHPRAPWLLAMATASAATRHEERLE